jgi:glycogen debranching enzyme
MFLTDTRHLSSWRLGLSGGKPLVLSSEVSSDYVAQIDLTVTSLHEGDLLGKEPVNYLHLRREQLIDDVFVERLRVSNFLPRPVDFWLDLQWAADFADAFEIRGARRPRRGTYAAPVVEPDRAILQYVGQDGRRYATEIRVEGLACSSGGTPPTASVAAGGARVRFRLEPLARGEATFVVAAGIERGRSARGTAPDEERPIPREPTRPFSERAAETRAAYAAWARRATHFRSSNDIFDRALEQAVSDLKALTVFHFGDPVISAGIPWYTCPFGRDALLSGYEALLVAAEIARDALRFLARLQGTRDDPTRDEEPGKILHEMRGGEMAVAGEVPHTPYYGSADATPLFIVLLCEYDLWTDDRETVEALLPAAERAAEWIGRFGDRDGDGLVEYERRTPKGLRNQGWKDSHDGVPFADGRSAEPPIALVEVQGYAYDARRRLAALHRRHGRVAEAERLEAGAQAIAHAVEERLWMEDRGTYAIALDREKRRVDAVTSNPGHLLFSRLPSPERARSVAATLLGPGLWSGWGIRTLASGQPAYNPLSYHNGTVWPHDNAICAMGLAHYDLTREASQILSGLWQSAQHFRQLRMPELFCGLAREERGFPVHYPVACSPQAWSSAAWFLLVRAMLGLHPDAPARTLNVHEPWLPPWLDELTLEGIRIGPARATLRFRRGTHGAFAEVLSVEGGPLRVRIEVAA